jgi:hypothetical protein
VSDVFRHRSETGKSYCQTRFDVVSERVKEQETRLTLREPDDDDDDDDDEILIIKEIALLIQVYTILFLNPSV